MSVLLFVNFYSELPDTFINYLYDKYPECCSITIRDNLDFNRWDISLRTDIKLNKTIKLYEKQYSSMAAYFKFEPTKSNGFITLDTKSNEEFLYAN